MAPAPAVSIARPVVPGPTPERPAIQPITDTALPPEIPRAWDGNIELTTFPGAALIVGVHVRTIYNMVRRGEIEVRYMPTGKMRIVVASLWRQDPTAAGKAWKPPANYRGLGTGAHAALPSAVPAAATPAQDQTR